MSPPFIQTGPRDARIIIVGEAPGETEQRTGKPFEGGSGELLTRMLDRSGIRRSECFLTNICHVRPQSNSFDWFLKPANQEHFLRGVLRLKQDIEQIRPNLVIGLGAQALRILTGKVGIDKWRGSILRSTLVPGVKVICTYHPAYILRVYDYKAVAEFDLRRCAIDATFPELRLPERTHYLHNVVVTQHSDGSLTRRPMAVGERFTIAQEMASAEWLAEDIECWPDGKGGWQLACVGFSDRADRSLVIHCDSPESVLLIRELSQCPAKKVFQNGTFDVTVLASANIKVTNFAWDTMLAHHSLFPECASGSDELSALSGKKRQSAIGKGLGFQTSLYTREPFYKDDGKLWKEEGDIEQFWLYNGRDSAVTREIRDVQEVELQSFGTMSVFEHEMSLVQPLIAATNRGIKIDLTVRAELLQAIEQEINNYQALLDHIAGGPLNVKSHPQIKDFLYNKLKLPVKRNRKTGNETGDKDAIIELAGKHPDVPGLLAILKIRERRDIIERYLHATVDADGRMRCSFDITGTRSGRLSSRQSIHGSGTNLQTIPARKKVGEQIKRMFVADPGYVLIIRDYSQAEAWVCAYLARCQALIDLLNDPTRDIHRETASGIFGKPISEISDMERYLAKRTVHSSNYGVGGKHLADKVNEEAETTGIRITASRGDQLIQGYFALYPELKENFWRQVENELRYSRTLVTPFGRKRTFYGRYDDKLVRDAYSFIPQSTVGDLGGRATSKCYYEIEVARPELGAQLLLNVHDSVIMQAPIEHAVEVAELMARCMAIPITIHGRTFIIPTDCKIGFNWSKSSDKNPDGIRDLEKGGREWLAQKMKNSHDMPMSKESSTTIVIQDTKSLTVSKHGNSVSIQETQSSTLLEQDTNNFLQNLRTLLKRSGTSSGKSVV